MLSERYVLNRHDIDKSLDCMLNKNIKNGYFGKKNCTDSPKVTSKYRFSFFLTKKLFRQL